MRNIIYGLFGLASIFLFSSCFMINLQTPPELCHEAFVNCGIGSPTFDEICSCECDEGAQLVGIFFGFQYCKCPNCPENFVPVPEKNCACYPKPFASKPDPESEHKNLQATDDYLPLQIGNVLIYDLLGIAGQTVGQYGLWTIDTLSVYMLNDSTGMAELVTLYFQAMIVPDQMGVLSDTVQGPTLYNLPEYPNFVAVGSSSDTSFVGFHSIPSEEIIAETSDYSIIQNIGEITVPAGTFDNCVFVGDMDNSGNVYAPNVGLIKIVLGGIDAVVLSGFEVPEVDEDCDGEAINITTLVLDGTEIKASDHITISSAVAENASVTFQAANYIALNPGFSVPLGAVVQLIIAACGE